MPDSPFCTRTPIEPLESRRLFAASVDSANVLQVTGTDGADTIVLSAAGALVQVNVNADAPQTFDPNTLAGITVHAMGGNDLVLITTALSGCFVFGDSGNDRVAGGDGNETLYGNAGKDQLDGGAGNDKLNGNGGNDKLFGNFGADRIYGGDGNDYLDGGSSKDRLFPQAGLDSVLGQSGDDNIFANDKTAEDIFGGSGIDTAILDGSDRPGSIEQMAVV